MKKLLALLLCLCLLSVSLPVIGEEDEWAEYIVDEEEAETAAPQLFKWSELETDTSGETAFYQGLLGILSGTMEEGKRCELQLSAGDEAYSLAVQRTQYGLDLLAEGGEQGTIHVQIDLAEGAYINYNGAKFFLPWEELEKTISQLVKNQTGIELTINENVNLFALFASLAGLLQEASELIGGSVAVSTKYEKVPGLVMEGEEASGVEEGTTTITPPQWNLKSFSFTVDLGALLSKVQGFLSGLNMDSLEQQRILKIAGPILKQLGLQESTVTQWISYANLMLNNRSRRALFGSLSSMRFQGGVVLDDNAVDVEFKIDDRSSGMNLGLLFNYNGTTRTGSGILTIPSTGAYVDLALTMDPALVATASWKDSNGVNELNLKQLGSSFALTYSDAQSVRNNFAAWLARRSIEDGTHLDLNLSAGSTNSMYAEADLQSTRQTLSASTSKGGLDLELQEDENGKLTRGDFQYFISRYGQGSVQLRLTYTPHRLQIYMPSGTTILRSSFPSELKAVFAAQNNGREAFCLTTTLEPEESGINWELISAYGVSAAARLWSYAVEDPELIPREECTTLTSGLLWVELMRRMNQLGF